MRKVLYLHHVAALAGAENSLRLLLGNLDRARYTPLFGGPVTGAFPRALREAGVVVEAVDFGPLREVGRLARAVLRVRALARAHGVDLLHSNGPQTNVVSGLAGRLAGVPVVWHARNLLHGRMRDVDRTLSPLPARIVCNSDAIRARFAGSRAWARAVTIVSAVDTREFSPNVPREPFRTELGVPPGEPLVGIVGRIGLGKGHETFVQAALALLASGAQVHFVVVGDALFADDAWRADALKRRVKDAGAEDRVRFTGVRHDIPRVMRGLDVLVLASDAEPCGRVLFEAMASGTAIVATDRGGTPELVRDGVEGLLVPPRDAGALVAALRRVLGDVALRARLGAAGVRRVTSAFTVERHVALTMALYDEVLTEAGR